MLQRHALIACLLLPLVASQTIPACQNDASSIGIPTPWFAFGFDSDPRPNTPGAGAAANYGFAEVDTNDSTQDQAIHRGLLVLTGAPASQQGSYINLSTSTGPDSVGVTVPLGNNPFANIGGSGSFSNSAAAGTAGWVFESTFKPTSQQTWSKLWDFGNPMVNGACRDDLLLGWRGDTNTFTFTYCDGKGVQNTIFSDVNIALNQWYHVAVVIQQLSDATASSPNLARYIMYINGVVPAGNVHQMIGPLPTRTFRQNSDVGKSSWNDAYFGAMLDSFNIFDSALNAAQINALYLNKMGGCAANIAASGTPRPTFTGERFPSGSATSPLSPYYELPTASAPANGNGGSIVWQQSDPRDAVCGLDRYHTGLYNLAGSSTPGEVGPYINVADASGPNSVGSVLPIIGGPGAGNMADYSQGWTFEFSVKAASIEQWSKLMDFSQQHTSDGHCHNDIVTGFYDDSPRWSFSTCNADNVEFKINDAFGDSTVDVWMHGVMVIQANADGTANYFTYRDGKLRNGLMYAYLPEAVARPNGFIGRSAWASDQYWDGLIDLFNVYNYAASPAQVLSLFNSRSGNGVAPAACDPQQSDTPDVMPTRAVFLDLNFDKDPRPSAGGNPGFGWLAFDSNDTAPAQKLHQNLLSLDGVSQYINLTARSGPNYIGQRFNPTDIGGRSSGSLAAGTSGWTWEITFKATARKNYAKLFDFGSGSPRYNILFGEFGEHEDQYTFELFDRNGQDWGASPAITGLELFKWYHVVAVIQQTRSGLANYYVYLNGELKWTRTEAWYLQSLPRNSAMMGKSSWNDAYWQGYVDTFRIYRQAATPTQALNMYRVEEGEDIGSSKSKLSGGAIAGAVIGSIVGAILLCLIVFCFCFRGGSSKTKKDTNYETGSGRFGEMSDRDVEMSQAGESSDV